MITANLVLTMIGLLFLLIGLVALYVWIGKSKTHVASTPATVETFESLSDIIKNRSSSSRELHHAVEMILKRFGSINAHTIGNYQYLLEALCVHPHTDSKLILRFEKTLRTHNPDYSNVIEKSLASGLAKRG